MGNIPRPNTSTRVVGGSVGRQRINAPVEAFGGGSGLAALGQGVAGLGAGMEAHQARKDNQAATEADLNITDTMDKWYAKNSIRRGPNARTLATEFDEMFKGSFETSTKGLTPQAREIVQLASRRASQRYKRQLLNIEARELKRSEQVNSKVKTDNKIKASANSIGMLEHWGFDYDSYSLDHSEELNRDIANEADKHDLTAEQRGDHSSKRWNEFHSTSLSSLLKNIESNTDATFAQLTDNIAKYKEVVKFSDLNEDQKKMLDDDADKVVKKRKADIRAKSIEFRNLDLRAQGQVADSFEKSIDQDGKTSWSWDDIEAANMSTSAKRYAKGVWRNSNDRKKRASATAQEIQQSTLSAVAINKQISSYDATADMDKSEWAGMMTAIDSMPSNLTGVKSGLRESLRAKTMEPFDNKDTMNVVINNLKDIYKLDKSELNEFFTPDGLNFSDEKNLDKRMGIYGSDVSNLRASAKEMTKSQFAIEAKRVLENANKAIKSDEAVNKAFNNLIKKPEAIDATAPKLRQSDLVGKPQTKRIKFNGQPKGTRPARLKDGSIVWYNETTGKMTPMKESK